MSKSHAELTVDGQTIPVSNLEKVLYPDAGFSKAQVIDYYIKAAPCLLPHLKDRPITLKRYPEGVDGFYFYERQCPAHRPDWVKTSKVQGSKSIDYCVLKDLPSLIWAANLADIELHTFLHRATALSRPTAIVFDLDPGPPADALTCCQVALWVKEYLEDRELESFIKTSGSKGLQLFVPLNTPATYDKTKPFAKKLAEDIESAHPELVVSHMQKKLRQGKVLIDWSQNDDHKTTVCVYSLRAKSTPSVSTPIAWEEVKAALKSKKLSKLTFDSDQALQRMKKLGDLFAPVLTLRQKLPRV